METIVIMMIGKIMMTLVIMMVLMMIMRMIRKKMASQVMTKLAHGTA